MSKYIPVVDEQIQTPNYLLVVAHTEYEQTVQLFITEEAARKAYKNWPGAAEIYLAKIIS